MLSGGAALRGAGVQDAAPAHRLENGGMAAPSQRMASQASPKAAVRDAKEARNARIRRSASFRSSITETLSPLEQLHLPIGFASVPPDHHSKRDSRNSLDDVAEVHVEARKVVVSDCVAHGVRAPGARDGVVLVADGSRSPRAMKLFRVMRGDYRKRPWDAAPHLLPDLIKQDREPWEDRVANCEKRRRELERAFRAKTLHELGRDDRRRARAARAHKDAALLRMVALGARAELMKGELLRDRREAAEEEDDDQEEQAVAATPSPKKRSRRRDRRRAAEALTGEASTKIGRWWLGLKIRWLLNGISIARRVRVTLTVTKITQQIIAKYRNRVYRRSADIIHHFLVKAEKCQGKRGMKLLVRKIKLAQRMVRGWVATRQARIAALHRAFALAEIDFQHELDRRRVEVEVHAIRRTSHPDSMFYAVWKSTSVSVQRRRREILISTQVLRPGPGLGHGGPPAAGDLAPRGQQSRGAGLAEGGNPEPGSGTGVAGAEGGGYRRRPVLPRGLQ